MSWADKAPLFAQDKHNKVVYTEKVYILMQRMRIMCLKLRGSGGWIMLFTANAFISLLVLDFTELMFTQRASGRTGDVLHGCGPL